MTHTFTAPSPLGPSVRDATLKSVNALPNAAGTVNGTVIDLGPITDVSARTELVEAMLTAPALTIAQLPNAVTATYSIQASALPNMASPTTIAGSCIVQTGANGAAGTTFRFKLPSNCPRYLQALVTTVTNAGNCAGSNMTLELLF
jgi:hypothetical protein